MHSASADLSNFRCVTLSDLNFNVPFLVLIEMCFFQCSFVSFNWKICFLLPFLCLVSERIASERGETIGENVGYKVILFMYLWCSNGTVILYLNLFCIEIFIWTLSIVIIIRLVFCIRMLHSHNTPCFYWYWGGNL